MIGRSNGSAERSAHIAAAVGPLLPGGDGHAGLEVELALHALPVARRREGELQVELATARSERQKQ